MIISLLGPPCGRVSQSYPTPGHQRLGCRARAGRPLPFHSPAAQPPGGSNKPVSDALASPCSPAAVCARSVCAFVSPGRAASRPPSRRRPPRRHRPAPGTGLATARRYLEGSPSDLRAARRCARRHSSAVKECAPDGSEDGARRWARLGRHGASRAAAVAGMGQTEPGRGWSQRSAVALSGHGGSSQLAARRGFIGRCGRRHRRQAAAAECPGNGANVNVSVNKAGALGRRRLRCNRVASLSDLTDFIRRRRSIIRGDHFAPVLSCRQKAAPSLLVPSLSHPPPSPHPPLSVAH